MKVTNGKVLEVYIPKQYKNGLLLDVMDRTLIGFKIETDEGIKQIELEANSENSKIYKNDRVIITIEGEDFIDIELDGDEYE